MDRIDAIHAFVRLVEIQSFSEVAKEIRVTQSTVSKWLAALEEELGVQLIERTTRTQRVTEAGQVLYERGKRILESYQDVRSLLQEGAPEPSGRLRISVPVVFGQRHVVPHMPKLLQRFRALEVELVFNDRYVNLVEEGFDAAIRVGIPVDSTLRARKLGVTDRVLVAAPSYLERLGAPRAPRDLQDHECLLHTGLAFGERWTFRHDGRSSSVRVHGRFSANHSDALLQMCRSGTGIALLAAWLVDADLRRGRLVSLLPGHQPPNAPIQALFAPGRFVHARLRAFLDFVEDSLRLPGESPA